MDQTTLWREYAALPAEGQQAVDQLIAALTEQYAEGQGTRAQDKVALADEPFVGMWRDREDMADSSAWVRSTRVREWTGAHG